MPDLGTWRWLAGFSAAFLVGLAKTGTPGVSTLIPPLMVLAVGDARYAAAWNAPVLIVGDIVGLAYWGRHADAKKLFSLIPWVALGMAGGAVALSLNEMILRRIIGVIVLSMLAIYIFRRWRASSNVAGHPSFYGIAAGFATTVANAAGPVMSMYLLSQRLPKERFVATGAWFFFTVNMAKLPIYLWYGLFSKQSLVFDACMVPVVIAGAAVGLWLVRRMPQRVFDVLVVVLTALSSVILFT
jgi:uncharacterized protein